MPLLLVDLDDTVVDRTSAFRRWASGFLASRGLNESALEWLVVEDERGYRPRPELFALVRERLALADPVDALVSDFYREFPVLSRCEEPVRSALAEARRTGWKIAIVTNGTPSQEDKIVAAGLHHLVDAWCISGVEGCRKPDRRLMEIAAERCGESLASAWMVGDSPEADIAGAHAAAIRSVWLRHGRSWPSAQRPPTYETDSFPHAVRLVLGHDDAGARTA